MMLHCLGKCAVATGLATVLLLGPVLQLAAAEPLPFVRKTIDAAPPEKPYYKMLGDVSGDGKVDIVVGGAKGPLVAYIWPDWQRTQLATGGWDGVNGEIADVDGDGNNDIVMGGAIWFANPGSGGGEWKKVTIDQQKAHDVELADLDMDGRLDVVLRDQSAFGKNGNWIAIYYQKTPQEWTRVTLDCAHGEGIKLGDIDQDGDHDILTGGVWFQNPRDTTSRWQRFVYTTNWQEPDAQVEMADFNLDGRPDIVLTPAELKDEHYKICWYEAPPNLLRENGLLPENGLLQENWREHIIVAEIECVIHSLAVGDFDGDGDIDVAIAEMHQGADPDEVSIYLNQGGGTSWQQQVLSTDGSHDIVVADIDGDGDLDIVGANHAGVHPLELWQNEIKTR